MLNFFKSVFASLFSFLFLFFSTGANAQEQKLVLASEMDTVAYGIGLSIAGSLKMQGLAAINTRVLQSAIQDALSSKATLFTQEEANQYLMSFFSKKEDSIRLAEDAKAEPNRIAGEKFLAENKTREGVTATESGLQYQVLKAGEGPKPALNEKVKVHYHGTLIDGTVFDSSVDRGEPIELPVSGVIAGWTEALQLMPVGSKWKLFIPYQLAYGDRGSGPKISPKSALVFEVELLEILK